jgi:ABC-type uncharacterized transport system substrate-binding protein
MRRRDVITLVGGAAALRPLSSLAQRADPVRRIGVMMANARNDAEGTKRIGAFRRELEKLGWIEGKNLLIDDRWAVGDPGPAKASAAELVSAAPDVILANGTPALAASQAATRSIPLVFVVVTDPVGAGYVQGLSRPGGNTTGFSTFEPEIGGKWVELLKEMAPNLRRVAGILDPAFRGFAGIWRTIQSLAPRLELDVIEIAFQTRDARIEFAVAAFAQKPQGGLIVFPTAINNLLRGQIFDLAATHRLPAIYPFRHYAVGGGLMSYGFDAPDLFRRAASYVDRILRGERVSDLPVQAPTKFELVINLKTAKALGLTVPQSLLARADEVIE